jgi:hypothetical protein
LLPTRARVPVIKDWENEGTADPDEARGAWAPRGEWGRFNIGVACGPSGLVVIDLDTKKGKDGPTELHRLLTELGIDLPKTYAVKTPSGGRHLYFRSPPGVEIRLSASQVAPGVDIRAWGGLVVAAGSEIDGRFYEVIADLPIADLPPEMIEHILKSPGSRSKAARAERIPEIIPEGERESTLASLAGSMRRRGASAAVILAAIREMNEEQCVPPLEEDDLERIAHSIARYEPADKPADKPGEDDEIKPDPDMVQKLLVQMESTRVATMTMKSREMRRQREILGGMTDTMNVLDFIAEGPDPTATCLWGVPAQGGVMAWAEKQGTIIAGPPGTGKSTIALQVILRRVGLLSGSVLGLPVREVPEPLVYLALDRADQIRQSLRRMVPPDADRDLASRLQLIDTFPMGVDLRQEATFISWLRDKGATCVVIDSAKDLGYDLNDSAEGQAFNFLVQATLRAGIQILITHHSRKTPRGDRKPLTLNDLHGSQWVAAGAGSVLMLDGEAGPSPKRLFHVKPLAVPMAPLQIELDTMTGEIGYRDAPEDEESPSRGGSGLQDRILEYLNTAAEPVRSGVIAEAIGGNAGSVHRACKSLETKGMIDVDEDGWVLA